MEEDLRLTSRLGGRTCSLSHSPIPWEVSRSVFDTKRWVKVFIGNPVSPRTHTGLLLLYYPEYIGVVAVTSKSNH